MSMYQGVESRQELGALGVHCDQGERLVPAPFLPSGIPSDPLGRQNKKGGEERTDSQFSKCFLYFSCANGSRVPTLSCAATT